MAFIDEIRDHKHRFNFVYKRFVNHNDINKFPKLFYWILSFIPRNVLEKRYDLVALSINILSFTGFLLFIDSLNPLFIEDHNYSEVLLVTSLLFILTPFQYYAWNAKNTGISVRGFGVMIGQFMLYAIINYLLYDLDYMLLIAIIFYWIALGSSQFGHQFCLFSTVLMSAFFLDGTLLFIPLLGLICFYLCFPRWSVKYIDRQIGHKIMYSKFINEKFHMGYRYSIWLDFTRDFFVKYEELGLLRAGQYIYRNPLLSSIFGFPILVWFIYYIVRNPYTLKLDYLLYVFTILIIIGILLFIIFSFRATRFLGQPERYIEFFIPIMTILAAIYADIITLSLIMLMSLIIIMFEVIVLNKIIKKEHGVPSKHVRIEELLSRFSILVEEDKNVVLFSNNISLLKHFVIDKYIIYNINITTPLTAGLHFKDIYPITYQTVENGAVVHFLGQNIITHFILDISRTQLSELETSNLRLELLDTVYDYEIYSVFR
jgi:hypothetical protein